MIVVIQCASGKQPHAGHLRTCDGRNVVFVAKPDAAPAGTGELHARPDDVSDTGATWRTVLQTYNQKYHAAPDSNPLGLLPAWKLYKNPAYRMLAGHCGTRRLYILSAGWGLIRSDFLTPGYDITFSNAERYKQRKPGDVFEDFPLPDDVEEPITFFGGRSYIPLFCRLTANARGDRTIFYAGKMPHGDAAPGCTLRRYGKPFANWHYVCARAHAEGRLRD